VSEELIASSLLV